MRTIYLTLLCLLLATTVCMPASAANKINYQPLITRWQQQINITTGTYGIYLIDIKTGSTAGINELQPFHAASTIKLPINLYLYEKISAGDISLHTSLTYQQKHFEGGTGYLQQNPVGSTFSISELAQASITHSDNVAINILYDFLGRANVKSYMRRLGGKVVFEDKNSTCPRDMAIYMNATRKFSRREPQLGNMLIHHLESTVFNERIPAGVPSAIKVAHKIGNWPPTGTYNDVAYVHHPDSPYILAIFSKNTGNRQDAFFTIRKISEITFQFHSEI